MIREPTPDTVGSERVNAKERNKKERRGRRAKERKGIGAQRAKPPTPTRVNDALIGDKEQKEKQKNKKKETGRGPQPSYPGPLGRSYDPQGSHGELILLTSTSGPYGEGVRVY